MNVLDTNIWLYAYDTREPRKQAIARNLIAAVHAMALPWQVGCEFISASRKLKAVGFTEDQAWTELANMQIAASAILIPAPDL